MGSISFWCVDLVDLVLKIKGIVLYWLVWFIWYMLVCGILCGIFRRKSRWEIELEACGFALRFRRHRFATLVQSSLVDFKGLLTEELCRSPL